MRTTNPADPYSITAEFYDVVDPYRNRQDVKFFVEEARASGGPVLELGCGTGRVLLPTAQAGTQITGLDRSPAMLALCREKIEREPAPIRERVRLIEGDMCAFRLEQKFALITVPFRPFQHLTEVQDQLACLACIREHLAEGGRLILDVYNPSLQALVDPKYLGEFGHEPEVTTADGRRVTRWAKMLARDPRRQVNDVVLCYRITYPEGRVETREFRFEMRYFFRYELEHLLARSGFEVEALYADYDRSPYGSKDPGELIFVARKR